MTLTKFGHCCLLIEENGVRILTDPGMFTQKQNEIANIHMILITHEHTDHFHIDSVQRVLEKNPKAMIVSNTAVAKLLKEKNIETTIVEHGQTHNHNGVSIEGIGTEHAIIHASLPIVPNTGYFIAGRLFYPGDAFTNPNKPVEILALPVAGPWMKISEAIDYTLAVKPEKAFPVHDGIYKIPGMMNGVYQKILGEHGIQFIVPEVEKEMEL